MGLDFVVKQLVGFGVHGEVVGGPPGGQKLQKRFSGPPGGQKLQNLFVAPLVAKICKSVLVGGL